MILYHGTNIHFEEIDLSKSNTNKDFGKGFYLSDTKEQAMAMAAFKVSFLGGEAIINEYDVPDNILQSEDLNVKVFKEYSEEWAKFVFENRDNSTDLIVMLMEDFGMDMKSAFDSLYNSETYAKLSDVSTGLYFQSSGYIYSYLRREITTGKLSVAG